MNRRTLLKSLLATPLASVLPVNDAPAYALLWPHEAGPLAIRDNRAAAGWFQIRVRKQTHQVNFYQLHDGRFQALVKLEDCHILVLWDRGPGDMDIVCNPKPGVSDVTLPVEWYRACISRNPDELIAPFPDHPHDSIIPGWNTKWETFG